MPDEVPARLAEQIADALRPAAFLVAPGYRIEVRHAPHLVETWEIYQGHLLDAATTRQQRSFAAWDVFFGAEASEPACLLSLRWDAEEQKLFVVRYLYVYGWETYEPEPNVLMSRQKERWIRELVGELTLPEDGTAPTAQLAELLQRAILGASRLPIASWETPLPQFSLGQLFYLGASESSSASAAARVATPDVLLTKLGTESSTLSHARLLEFALRVLPAEHLAKWTLAYAQQLREQQRGSDWLLPMLEAMFHHLALTPYTAFEETLVAFLTALHNSGGIETTPLIDLLAAMLIQLGRHLTAFDVRQFHHRGADYPDLLLLDALLAQFLGLCEEHAELFVGEIKPARRRRRALRQGVLLRRSYEGLPVPDVPTSPGDQMRVLPERFVRVPEAQFMDVTARSKHLFAEHPTADLLTPATQKILRSSVADLQLRAELEELGKALFLDRPLGIGKPPGAVDRTPLVSYIAVSRQLIRDRLELLTQSGWLSDEEFREFKTTLRELPQPGIPALRVPVCVRPGVVSLADAMQAATDFRFLQCTRRAWDELLSGYDLSLLASVEQQLHSLLTTSRPILAIRQETADGGQASLCVYDRSLTPQLWLHLNPPGMAQPPGAPLALNYIDVAGTELLAKGLWVEPILSGVSSGERIHLPPRR